MHKSTALLATLLMFASVSPARTKTTRPTSGKTSHAKHSTKSRTGKKTVSKSKKVRGQRAIDEQRAQQIQAALIREHYLSGEATGQWDQRSKEAMQRYQADNGWQTKVVPDSRALIKLGLGPSKDNLINPETAATASVPVVSAPETSTGGGSAFRQ